MAAEFPGHYGNVQLQNTVSAVTDGEIVKFIGITNKGAKPCATRSKAS